MVYLALIALVLVCAAAAVLLPFYLCSIPIKTLPILDNSAVSCLSSRLQLIYYFVVTVAAPTIAYGAFKTWTELVAVRKKQRLDINRRRLEQAITVPADSICSYAMVYQSIYSHYSPLLRDEPLWIDGKYFDSTVARFFSDHLSFTGKLAHSSYLFPLVSDKSWIKSANPGLAVQPRLESFDTVELTDDDIKNASRRFTLQFGVEDLPSFLTSLGKVARDDPTFDLTNVSYDGDHKILDLTFKLGTYFNFLKTYDLVRHELYYHLASLSDTIVEWHSLQTREAFGIKRFKNVVDFSKRPAKFGINAFCLFKRSDGTYATFFQKRRTELAEYPGFFHVAPAGTYQPLSIFDVTDIRKQFSFEYTVLREALEEIYDLEGADRSRAANPFQIFTLEKGKLLDGGNFVPGLLFGDVENDLTTGQKSERYEIVVTGFLVDLVSMKPELTVILLVKDPDVYVTSQKRFAGNWEGAIKEFTVSPKDAAFQGFVARYVNADHFLPAGAVAVAEGLHYCREMLGIT